MYISRLGIYNRQVTVTMFDDDLEDKRQFFERLKTALRTSSTSFVLQFLERDGLLSLLIFLQSMDNKVKISAVHTLILGCIKAVMNVPEGRKRVLENQKAVNVVCQATVVDNIRTKTSALEILGALCLVPGGHRKVLVAMSYLSSFANERVRFQSLISDLCKQDECMEQDLQYKTAVLSFINAALKYGAGEKSLEFRLHLRYEFLMLGLGPVLENLRDLENESILKHIEFFERFRLDDEEAIAKRFQVDHIDSKDEQAMLSVLKNKLYASEAYPEFMSVLLHMCLMPFGSARNVCYWRILNKFIQQLILQKEDGSNPDIETVKISFADLLDHLKSEIGEMAMDEKLKSLQSQVNELTEKLKEKDEKSQVCSSCSGKGTPIVAAPPPPPIPGGSSNPPPPPPIPSTAGPPPPPPPMNIGPPPPPPPGLGPPGGPPPPPAMGGFSTTVARQKNIPKSSNPLKSLNWSKIPENKISGTIWSELNDEQVFKVLDLADFERQFSAFQKPDEDFLPERKFVNTKSKELSLIDGRRSQNCIILLSKLKLTNDELLQIILRMDNKNQIPNDLFEEILKFTPTAEEISLLQDHKGQYAQMARADQYFFDLGQLGHYNERLTCLVFKKRFFERVKEVTPNLDSVIESAKRVRFSKKLQKMLEYILAFGNYMNKGARGNAYGFKLDGLTKVVDTKSSLDKTVTLLHYIIDMCGKKSPEILDLPNELQCVKRAARVHLTELEKEMNSIRGGIKQAEKELDYHKKNPSKNSQDKFVSEMSGFLDSAHQEFSELEEKLKEAQEKYKKAVKHFGEDPSKLTSDAFFAIFETFLQNFEDVQADLERRRLRAEEEAKQGQRERQNRSKLAAAAAGAVGELSSTAKANANGLSKTKTDMNKSGEFDDLITALQSGDVFLEDLNKMKRTSKRKGSFNPSTVNLQRESLGGAAAR